MARQVVCKTVVPFPEKHKYVAVFEAASFVLCPTLTVLAARLRLEFKRERENIFIKNEVPCDIIWARADGVSDGSGIIECERLSREEIHQLAKLLEQG